MIAHSFRNRLRSLPRWLQITLTLIIIAAIIALVVLYGPREGTVDNITGDSIDTPTVVVTNQLQTSTVRRQLVFQGIHFTVQQAALASKFSDDRKYAGKYTLRVFVVTKNPSANAIGADYVSLITLLLPSGTQLHAKLISVKPALLPGETQEGFFDFPLDAPLPLTQCSLRFGTQETVPLHS